MPYDTRSRLIDVMRGGAAIAVALYHFNAPFAPQSDFYHRAAKCGWLGVPVFFVISGYCIAAARTKDDITSFWRRRLMRIYPPYWASLLTVLAVAALRVATAGVNDVTPIPRTPVAWIYTVAALTTPSSSVPGINWAYWSLGYEVAFYVLMGFVFLRGAPWPTVAVSVIALWLSPRSFPFDQWGLFALGVACHFFRGGNRNAGITLAILSVAQIAWHLSVAEIVAAIPTAIAIAWPPAVINARLFEPLRRAGMISYSLYLTHVPIGCFLMAHYLSDGANRALVPAIGHDVLLLAGCLAFAWGFHRVIEKPSHELARRPWRSIRRAPPAAMATTAAG